MDSQSRYYDALQWYAGEPHGRPDEYCPQRFVGHGPGDSNRYEFNDDNLAGRHDLSAAALHYIGEFLHDKKGKIKKKKGMPAWKEWRKKDEQFLVFDGDCQQAQLSMNRHDIYRAPEELYNAYMSHPNEFVRDFIAYYVLWSWHYNWYPNASVGPYDTSPGPNDHFDPLDP